MKTLISQNWEIAGEDEESIRVNFTRYDHGIEMDFHHKKTLITFNEEQIKELKNILDSTKFIFNQNKM